MPKQETVMTDEEMEAKIDKLERQSFVVNLTALAVVCGLFAIMVLGLVYLPDFTDTLFGFVAVATVLCGFAAVVHYVATMIRILRLEE